MPNHLDQADRLALALDADLRQRPCRLLQREGSIEAVSELVMICWPLTEPSHSRSDIDGVAEKIVVFMQKRPMMEPDPYRQLDPRHLRQLVHVELDLARALH